MARMPKDKPKNSKIIAAKYADILWAELFMNPSDAKDQIYKQILAAIRHWSRHNRKRTQKCQE